MAQPAIGEVLTTIEPMALPKGIRIANDVDRDLVVWADRLRFKQILYNLLNNAVKFTAQDGKVSISSGGDEESTEITVSDTRGWNPTGGTAGHLQRVSSGRHHYQGREGRHRAWTGDHAASGGKARRRNLGR
ncbi:MAG: ATP-binding protein [Ignavibacteriota bacterium]